MKFDDLGIAFPQEFIRAVSLVSVVSVWVLAGLFYYLNRRPRRDSFTIWTGAWLLYALWQTMSPGVRGAPTGSALFTLNQVCISMSAAFLLWGSMRFLNFAFPPGLSGAIAMFLAVWILAGPHLLTGSLPIHLPVFILLGLSSPFAGACFLRLRRQKKPIGMGMVSLAFLLWIGYVERCPFSGEFGRIHSAGFLFAAVLQFLVAVAMIFAWLQEVRPGAGAVEAEIEAVRQEKYNAITTKEACQHLYNRMVAAEETEKALLKMRHDQQAAAERERLQALGQMAGDVAHDINNALAPITAYSELLLNTLTDLPDVPRERLERINRAAEEVAQIVAHMREFYRPAPQRDAIAGPDNGQIVEQAPKSKLDPDRPNRSGSCRSLRILVIDDEPNLRQVLHDVLEADLHQVTVASGGGEGIDLFRSALHAGDPFEVVITDLGMPEIDGRHVARAIKAQSSQTPVIMLTGWGAMLKSDGQTDPGVDVVLGKPPRAQELNNLLYQITERNASLS
jgi:CheY-like chemotaxis protein